MREGDVDRARESNRGGRGRGRGDDDDVTRTKISVISVQFHKK